MEKCSKQCFIRYVSYSIQNVPPPKHCVLSNASNKQSKCFELREIFKKIVLHLLGILLDINKNKTVLFIVCRS
jgi:hypothetical protein